MSDSATMINLPKWQCHKVVEAVQIYAIALFEHKAGYKLSTLEAYDIAVSIEYYAKHHPQVGGYYVKYEDGYESYSPKEAFEQGYTRIEG
jgi:hypothetical protein